MMKNKLWSIFLLVVVALPIIVACGSDDDEKQNNNNGSSNATIIAVTEGAMVGATYAVVNGSVNLNMINIGSITLEYGAEVSQTEDFYNSIKTSTRELEGNKLKVLVRNLKSQTKYYYRVYLKASGNYYYGATQTFTTKDYKNVFSASSISDITLTSANAKFIVDMSSFDKNESLNYRVAYSLANDFNNIESHFSESPFNTILNDNEAIASLTKLQPATTYYYCSCTSDGETYKFGEIKSFTTLSNSDYKYLNTTEVKNIHGKGATLQGWSKLENLYKDKAISYYFHYSDKYENLTDNNDYFIISSFNDNGNLSADVTSLTEGTKYYYRISATVDNIRVFTGMT